MTPPYFSSKETEVPEVVGTLTLVITQSRTGEHRPSSDFREFISLNFLALPAILGIKFPWSLYLADFQRRVSAIFSSFSVKLALLPNQTKDLPREVPAFDLLNLPYRQGLGLFG